VGGEWRYGRNNGREGKGQVKWMDRGVGRKERVWGHHSSTEQGRHIC
jgi:hypothetical protein